MNMSRIFDIKDMETILPPRRDLPQRTVGQEVLVRDPDTGQVHFLNPTAALIWQSCDGATSLDACVRLLRTTFSIPEDIDLATDVGEIVTDFAQRGILHAHRADA